MNESDAKHYATLLTNSLGNIIPGFDPNELRKPITLAEILCLGFMLAASVRQNYAEAEQGFPVPQQLLSAMYAYPANPDLIQNLLYDGLLKSDEDPFSLDATIESISRGTLWGGYRKELKETFNRLLPPPSPGASRISPDDYPSVVERNERLRPFYLEFVRLRQRFPGKAIPEILEFLKSEYSGECSYTSARLKRMEELTSACAAFQNAKTLKRKARILADLMTCCDYELGPVYALQKVQEARRRVVGKERKRKPRLPESAKTYQVVP